jgi:ABC-2 type transport system ATP-binding protein
MSPAWEMRDVRKSFGRVRALAGMSFEIPAGTVCGMIGPNGSGKTTSFALAAGLVRPDAGEIRLFGERRFESAHMSGRVGLMPQDAQIPLHAQVGQWLRQLGRLQGLGASDAEREAQRVLEDTSLLDVADRRVSQLSHGMRKRVALAQALLGEPELLLLDEPTNGLDPKLAAKVRAMLASYRGRATVVISSHILSDLEEICDHVIFVEEGRCTKAGSVAALAKRGERVRVRLAAFPDLEALAAALPGFRFAREGEELVADGPTGAGLVGMNGALLPALIEAGAEILEVRAGERLTALLD